MLASQQVAPGYWKLRINNMQSKGRGSALARFPWTPSLRCRSSPRWTCPPEVWRLPNYDSISNFYTRHQCRLRHIVHSSGQQGVPILETVNEPLPSHQPRSIVHLISRLKDIRAFSLHPVQKRACHGTGVDVCHDNDPRISILSWQCPPSMPCSFVANVQSCCAPL